MNNKKKGKAKKKTPGPSPESGFWRGGNLSIKTVGSGGGVFFAAKQQRWEHNNNLSCHYKKLSSIKSNIGQLQNKSSKKNVSPRQYTRRRLVLPTVDTIVLDSRGSNYSSPNRPNPDKSRQRYVHEHAGNRKRNRRKKAGRQNKGKKIHNDKLNLKASMKNFEPNYLKSTFCNLRRIHEIKNNLPPINSKNENHCKNKLDALEKQHREEKEELFKLKRRRKRDMMAEKARERERIRYQAERNEVDDENNYPVDNQKKIEYGLHQPIEKYTVPRPPKNRYKVLSTSESEDLLMSRGNQKENSSFTFE